MEKILALFLTTMLALSMTACGGTPSDNKIKAALEDGTITVADAKAKGWIDEEWIKENFEQIEAKSKIYLLDPFETTYLDGTPASSELIEGKMCLVFINELIEETAQKLDAFNRAYEDMEEIGVPVLGVVSDEVELESAKETLKAITFPLITRNEDMNRSLALWGFGDMLDSDVLSVFTKDGGIYTAWSSKDTAEGLISYAKNLANEE